MLTRFLLVAVALLSVSCLGGDGDGTSTPISTVVPDESASEERTATPTAPATEEATPAATPSGPAALDGATFRAEGPGAWLGLPGDGVALTSGQRDRIEALPEDVAADVLDIHEESPADLIFMGLPESAFPRILVATVCGEPWDFGPGDWSRTAIDGFEAIDVDTRPANRRVVIDGIPYPLFEVESPDGISLDVFPVSRDGCTYAVSLRGADGDADVAEYLEFLRTMALGGRRTGDVPPRWEPIEGRRFTAHGPADWFYNDPALPLTEEQGRELLEMPPVVSSRILVHQDELDQIEILYPGMPAESDSVLNVLGQCWSTTRTPLQWTIYMVDSRTEQGRIASEMSFRAPVDGASYAIYEVRYPDDPQRIDYEVYPVGENDCTYLFSFHPSPNDAFNLSDFVAFLETVDLLDRP